MTGNERLLFFLRYLRSPRNMGSITPSSRYLVAALVRLSNIASARIVVELGPGTGPFTAGLLAEMRPDARLLCVERDPALADHLRARFRDPRLTVLTGDAQDLERFLADEGIAGRVPLIVSGLPFSSLPAEVRHGILATVTHCLAPDGLFLLYQYSPAMRSLLRRYFHRVESRWELRNFPPALVMRCTL